MYVLVTYDVNTKDKNGEYRLRKVAKVCQKYGHRVQNSVFECLVNPSEFLLLKHDLDSIILKEDDSIRFYKLPKNYSNHIECMGKDLSLHLEETTLF